MPMDNMQMNGMPMLKVNVHDILTAWQSGPFSFAVLLTLVLLGYWYLHATHLLAERNRVWPRRRTVNFLLGLGAIELALQSPVATFTQDYFTSHIIQHLLLMLVAPPLLALGAPSTLFLQTSSRKMKKHWLSFIRSGAFAIISHPISVWFIYYGFMFIFFLTPLIGIAMEHMALMDLINLAFLGGGTLFWWPIIGIDPILHWRMGYIARVVNLLIGVPVESFLAIAILSERSPIAPMYTVSDTHAGGALLWILSEAMTLPALVPLFRRWVGSDEREGSRMDARISHKLSRTERSGWNSEKPDVPSAWEAHWIARTGGLPPTQEVTKPADP